MSSNYYLSLYMFCRFWYMGAVFGKIVVMALVLDMLLNRILEWWRPSSKIDICPKSQTSIIPECVSRDSCGIHLTDTSNHQIDNKQHNLTVNYTQDVNTEVADGMNTETPRRSLRIRNRLNKQP